MGLEVFSAFSVHGYGQRPDDWEDATWGFGQVTELFARYRAVLDELGLEDRPLWATEFGGPPKDFGGDQQKRGRYYGEMTATLSKFCAVTMPFKYEDNGVPGFGMVGTPALATVSAVARRAGMQASGTSKTDSVPETIKEPQGGTVPQYTIDSETRKAISDKGWTPASSYILDGGGGFVYCLEGICLYLNGPGVYRFVNFD